MLLKCNFSRFIQRVQCQKCCRNLRLWCVCNPGNCLDEDINLLTSIRFDMNKSRGANLMIILVCIRRIKLVQVQNLVPYRTVLCVWMSKPHHWLDFRWRSTVHLEMNLPPRSHQDTILVLTIQNFDRLISWNLFVSFALTFPIG